MIAYIMCGLPGSGKSTWAKNKVDDGCVILSKDKIREMIHGGYRYDPKTEQIVGESIKTLLAMMYVCFPSKAVIIDETNISKKKRKEWIDLLDGAERIICVYCSSAEGNLDRRMTDSRGVSKETWNGVIESMRKSFESPTEDEGYYKIIEVPYDSSY